MIAVCVTFDIVEGQLEPFLTLMHRQAETSLAQEEGCHHFDVCTQNAIENRVFLYEVYTERAAFDLHLASEHFKTFDAAVAAMIMAKSVDIYDRIGH